VPFSASWPGSLWNLWYPPPAPTAPMALSSRKALPYLIYFIRTNPDAHVWMFFKTIQAISEKKDVDIVNLFCFTIKYAISKWGKKII
jgi:hypothetical protein